MSYKTAIKVKVKPLSTTALTKKPDELKKKYEGLKIVELKPKASMPGMKLKTSYGAHKPSAFQIHDAGHGVEYAEVANFGAGQPLAENEAELADKLVAEVANTSADVKALCETYDLKREELGRLTGFSLRALADWAAGELPSQPAKRRLHEVRRLLDALAEIVKPESIPKWLHQTNPAFAPLTPLQVIELGEIDRLWAMVYDLGSGQPS